LPSPSRQPPYCGHGVPCPSASAHACRRRRHRHHRRQTRPAERRRPPPPLPSRRRPCRPVNLRIVAMASLARQRPPSALACRRCRRHRHRRRWTRPADRCRPPPLSPSRHRPRRPVNLVLWPWRSDIPPPFPVGAGDTCGGIPTDERNGRNSLFLFTAQLFRKMNLAEIFSEARSGTIAHQNKKELRQAPTKKKSTLVFLQIISLVWWS